MDEDPGWPPPWKSLLAFIVPGLGIRRAARAQDGLLALRSIFIAFSYALVAIFVVCLVLSAGVEQTSPLVPGLFVLLWAALTQVLARIIAPTLDWSCSSPGARTR